MKIHPFKIPKPLGENLILQIDKGVAFYDKLHQHEEIQMSYIVKGDGKLIVGDSVHSYNEGDFFVIGSNIPHLFQSDANNKESHMTTLFFSKSSFGKDFFELPELKELQIFFKQSDIGFRTEKNNQIVRKFMMAMPQQSKLNRFVHFLELLNILGKTKTRLLTKFVYPRKFSNDDGQRLQTIFDYTINNFQTEITLKKIAELAFMTPNAFCRFLNSVQTKLFLSF